MCHLIKRDINITNLSLPFLEGKVILTKTEKIVALFELLSS